jgi:uncharacterized protein DUF3293
MAQTTSGSSTMTDKASLVEAYLSTIFAVSSDGGDHFLFQSFTMHFNKKSTELERIHAHHGVNSSMIITAFNPFSEVLGLGENLRNNQVLADYLDEHHLPRYNVSGQSPCGNWVEPSFLVLGADERFAKMVGEKFQQNAVVHSGADCVPTLVMLKEIG